MSTSTAGPAPHFGDDPWAVARTAFLANLNPIEQQLFSKANLENIYYKTSNLNRNDSERSKTRLVVQKLEPLVSAIENYGKSLDTFTNIYPVILAPIWGSLRVVLVVAQAHERYYGKIVDTLSRIGDIVPRFRDYERIYNPQKHPRLTQALSKAYLEIIILCTEFQTSIRELKASSVRRILRPLSLDRQFDAAIERFREHRQIVEEEARMCHMIEAAELRDEVAVAKSQQLVRQAEQLVLHAAERRKQLLSKLSSVNCKIRHQKLSKARHEGTGNWLGTRGEFENWDTFDGPAVLCCYGIPGCGKSFLASNVIDLLSQRRKVLFYYCDYADQRTLDPSNVFGALARQALERLNTIPDTLALEIEQAGHDGDTISDPQTALQILRRSIGLLSGQMHIVFDGIDEVSESSKKILLDSFRSLLDNPILRLKLFITGREEVEELHHIKRTIAFSKVLISSAAISADIESYVRASTRNRIEAGALELRDGSLEDLIVEKLVEGAKGMFLWVEFQLQELCDTDSDHSIMAVLQNLPKSLIETYDRLLNKIEAADRRTIIKSMFEWIMCARQPLLVDELREGISFTLEDDFWDQAKIMTNFARLIRACGNLVVVDTFEEQIDKPFRSVKKTRFVHLAHYTLQQYLLLRKEGTFHFNLNEANVMVGEVCVAYLSFDNFNSQLVRFKENATTEMVNWGRLAGQGAFLPSDLPGRRAVQVWNALRSADTTSMEIDMVRHIPRLKREPELAAFNLVSYISTHWLWHTIHFKSGNSSDTVSHTRIARRDDLFRDLIFHKHLLFKFRPWEAVNSSNEHLTYIAMLGWGFAANHQYLIEIASQRFDWNEPVTVVQQAWEWLLAHECNGFLNGHISKAMVDQLEAFSEDSYSMEQPELAWLYSRLLCACRKGHFDVIRDLGLEISQVDPGIIKHMLTEAAAFGQLPVVSYLQSILDPNESVLSAAWKGQYLNALERAVLGGHPQVVMFLKKRGYQISSLFIHVDSYFDLVDSAVDQDKAEVLRCLFLVTDKTRSGPGIDEHITDNQTNDKFTLTDRRGTFAFFRAIENGSVHAVQAMLEYGVYPDMHDERGYTALIAAITTSQEAIVQILLSYNCHTGNTAAGMPLTVAASMGNLAIAKLLLHSGAEVFACKLSNPRSSAMVSLIGNESHELDGNPGFGDLCICPTPLFMACYHGHREMVQMLLENGAAPDFPSVMALTHIYRSSGENANPVRHVDLFLHNIGTAEVANHVIWYWEKEQNSAWQYPLMAALLQGHENIAQLLVEAGVQLPLSSTSRSGPLSGQSLLREFRKLHASELLKQMRPGPTHSLEKEIFTNLATGLSYFTTISVNYFEDLFAYVETLIAAGVPVDEVELDGKPILISAMENNQHMLVKRVIQQMPAGALHSSLVGSVKNNMPSLIPALLRAGAKISRQDDNGVDVPNQSLVHAALIGNSFLHDALIEATMVATLCSVTSNPSVSLEESSGSRENLQQIIICILLEMGEETSQAPWYCDILQHLARRDGNCGSMLSALFNLTATFPDRRLLMDGFLFAAIEKEDCDLAMLLCDKGADVNAEFVDDTNHLIRAVKRARSLEIIRTLLALGADPNITDASGVSAIQIANEYYGELDPVWCLLTNNQSARTDGRQQVLDFCVAEGLEATWRVITGLDLHETLYLDDTWFPSYLMARGQYLLNAPCRIIPGIFELAHETFELAIDATSPGEKKKPTTMTGPRSSESERSYFHRKWNRFTSRNHRPIPTAQALLVKDHHVDVPSLHASNQV